MFKCKKCGACCRHINMNKLYKELDKGDGCCKYLNLKNNKCIIYDKRPLLCRVDESYREIFYKNLTLEEYYRLNYEACKRLNLLEDYKMSEIKELLSKKFEEIFGYEPSCDYMKRVNNAKEIMCQGKYNKEDLIKIFDTSISSNGKSGLVLTVDSVCVKDSANSTSKFIAKYEDIDFTYINREKFLGTDISTLELNMKYGSQYKISICSLAKLKEFIDYAISLYEENYKLEW
ncbi:YkgJ family cysteine cluster protein [Clostridium perfringens]|nr:YkgJ family cysteine cluster protein [Clostridium perfringens]